MTLQLGAWHKEAVLNFEIVEHEDMSKVSEEGTTSIAVDAIDHMIPPQQKVDFIKMDIEGSELNALKGAENVIRKYKPILTICVYHKKRRLNYNSAVY